MEIESDCHNLIHLWKTCKFHVSEFSYIRNEVQGLSKSFVFFYIVYTS